MVYSLEVLNSQQDVVSIQNTSNVPARAVTMFYNGSGIQDIAGPTPFVDFSTSIERNDAGEPNSIVNRITINGKIVRFDVPTEQGSISGISGVMSAINTLQSLFKLNSCGTFEIFCKSGSNNSKLFSANNVRVSSFEANKSSDNWLFTSDYSVVLEYLEPVRSGWYVKEYSDTWSIEPLEDYIYAQGNLKVTQKVEYDNPLLKPTAPTTTAGQPTLTSSRNDTGATPISIADISYINIPQFKISRTLSAVGIPSNTPLCSGITNIDRQKYSSTSLSAFNNAKQWVMDRSSSVFSGMNSGTLWSPVLQGGYFYNHLRATNFNIDAGRYEITDSWLAMPTGISFIEDYSIDVSTDDKYVHTVRVQGEIIGLTISNPIISGLPYVSGSGDPTRFDLTSSTDKGNLNNIPFNTSITDINALTTSKQLKQNKYDNALSGWINEVKPYLYRRACIPMTASDRTKGYVRPISNPPQPPNNPVYSRHGTLNIIPVSTSETHNLKKGSISYSYEFNNKFTLISGVLYENISIEETGPTDVIGEAFVLGRSLGPVLQNLGTKTSTKKSITIEVGVAPPSSMAGFFMQNKDCPLWTGGTVYGTITGIIEGLKPFGDRASFIFGNVTNFNRPHNNTQGQVYVTNDTQSWDPSSGRYVKSIGWIYQQCNNNKNYLDY